MTEEELLPFCECGECGRRVTKKGNRFIHGHNHRGRPHTPEHCAAISVGRRNSDAVKAHNESMRGVPRPPEVGDKISAAKLGVPQTPEARAANSKGHTGVSLSPEHCAANSKAHKESEAVKAEAERQRGGNDLVTHHYIYDHNDLSLNTVQMTRSDHARLHALLRKLGYIVPHINLPDEPTSEARDEVL